MCNPKDHSSEGGFLRVCERTWGGMCAQGVEGPGAAFNHFWVHEYALPHTILLAHLRYLWQSVEKISVQLVPGARRLKAAWLKASSSFEKIKAPKNKGKMGKRGRNSSIHHNDRNNST